VQRIQSLRYHCNLIRWASSSTRMTINQLQSCDGQVISACNQLGDRPTSPES
jgi:hypothetical protein